MIIYKITNKNTKKVYIGKTCKSLRCRIRNHLNSKVKSHIDRALKKYGLKEFDIDIIDCANDIKELNEKEIFWIKSFNSIVPNGYNIRSGGEGGVGFKHSEKHKIELSKRQKGKKQSDEFIKKRANGVKEFWSNPKNKERMKAAMAGKTSDEERQKRSQRKKEFWANPENKKMLSERMKTFWSDPEKRKKFGENMKRCRALRKATS